MNISLPDALKVFVDEQARLRGYANLGDYLRSLIRKEQEREGLRGLLIEGAAAAPAAEADDAFFESLRRRVRSKKSG